jgi:hypothetical protein
MNNILDKKSKEELLKHKNNFYKSKLTNRKKINIKNIFEINNIITNTNIFLVNIKKFSGFEGHYYFSSIDPLVNTALQILNKENILLENTFLYNYYQKFQPKTYGEVYHLSKNNKLHQLESTNHFHPWIHKKPTNKFRPGLFGPKDITNVIHRILRLKNLIKNINQYGYIPSNDDIIEGYILLKDDDFRFLISAGHHRVAVLTALYINGNNTYENLQVKYDNSRVKVKIIHEKDISNWPGVKSKYISDKDALEMFNKYFN